MGERKGPRPPLLHQGGEGRPQFGPSCEEALLEGAMLWALTWWASHPHRAPAARVSLGASGPRKPRGTNSIWGEKRQQLDSSGLAQPRPGHAHTSTYHLEGAEGASGFLWFPAALGWGVRRGLVLPRVSAPAPPAARSPWTPALRGPWRHIGELGRQARMGVKLGASGSADWNLAPPSSFPRRSVLPTDPLTSEASIPGAALDSWGTPEWGGVLRGSWGRGHCPLRDSQHLHLWRKRTVGWVPASHQGQASSPRGGGAGRPGGQQSPAWIGDQAHRGPELHQKCLWFSDCTVHHIHCKKVITRYHSHPCWILRLSPCLLGCAVFSCVYLHVSMYI